MKLKRIFDVIGLQTNRGFVHVLFGKQQHRAGLDLVGQGIQGTHHSLHGVDQVLLRNDQAEALFRLGVFGECGHVDLFTKVPKPVKE